MPGIFGFIDPLGQSEHQGTLDRMLSCLKHESSYRFGALLQSEFGLGAGWVCHPDSYSDCLPIWNQSRDICLIFFGEHFGERREAEPFRQKTPGCSLDDARWLVHWYEEKGLGFLPLLNGWFAGLIIDHRQNKVILFNDRYGFNRVYYAENKHGFHFASEAKALLEVMPELRKLDQQSLAEYVVCGCALQNRTIFSGVSLLPPGSVWTFHRDGRISKQNYFNPANWEQQEKLTPEGYGEKLKDVFGRIAPRYLGGKRHVAMSLTGGLDSRMILAWAQAAPGKLPCYTFGGPYRDCADVKIARELAKVCHQPHVTLPVGDDFFKNFGSLAEQAIYFSDGAMDVSGAVELSVNRLAKQVAPVRLTGNYGSEILRANVAFRPGKTGDSIFTPEFRLLMQGVAETYRHEVKVSRHAFIAFKQVPWHHHARQALEQSQLTLRSPFLDNELVAMAFQVPPELATDANPLLQLIAAGNPALDRVRTDRALRRHPVPLLSKLFHQWQEFTVKAEYAYDYGMPQKLARIDHKLRFLHLERLFLGRHKFYHFRIWYREQLRDYVKACGNDADAIPGCYRPEAVRRIVADHLTGRGNFTSELHKLLSIRLVEQLFVRSA